jgi:hypothetical protein
MAEEYPDVIIQQKCPGESSRAVGFTEDRG